MGHLEFTQSDCWAGVRCGIHPRPPLGGMTKGFSPLRGAGAIIRLERVVRGLNAVAPRSGEKPFVTPPSGGREQRQWVNSTGAAVDGANRFFCGKAPKRRLRRKTRTGKPLRFPVRRHV